MHKNRIAHRAGVSRQRRTIGGLNSAGCLPPSRAPEERHPAGGSGESASCESSRAVTSTSALVAPTSSPAREAARRRQIECAPNGAAAGIDAKEPAWPAALGAILALTVGTLVLLLMEFIPPRPNGNRGALVALATLGVSATDGFIAEVIEDHILENFVNRTSKRDDTRVQAAEELVEIVHSYFK